MFDLVFIASLFGFITQAIKETREPVVQIEKETYPEPHRDPESGKIVIENCKLYYEDMNKYGVCQARKWIGQGRYNLSKEDLEKEKARINAEYDKICKR